MDVLQGREGIEHDSAVTIGFFDGVHRGHRAVLARTVEVARAEGLRPVAVTFDRHPREVLTPGDVPPLLTTLRRKAGLIEETGIETLVVLAFDPGMAGWTPAEFVDRVLVERLRARRVVVGENFTFGHKAAGDVGTLQELGAARSFTAEGVPLLQIDGRPVSSTSIRDALGAGDLEWPTEALGRRYVVEGTVVPGAGRGVDLGFPTANLLTPPRLLLPGRGVYAGRAFAGEEGPWTAAINVGINPTFGEEPLHVEAYLLDFEGDLKGRVLGVEFWARLRDEVRFDSTEALSSQIREDVERTRSLVR